MDRARRCTTSFLCELVRRSTVGFRSESIRFAKVEGEQVIGLKRTGKSCRLRWVNYLHPGLKRGKMTPHEERLVLELHSKWGNRWSRIARKLPGRTDNEIKNYWRTHMRKKAQEKKKTNMSSSSSSSFSNSTATSSKAMTSNTMKSIPDAQSDGRSFYDTGGFATSATGKGEDNLDEIWKDIELCQDNYVTPIFDGFSEGESYFSCQTMASPPSPPLWDVSLWATEDPYDIATSYHFYSFYNQDNSSMLTG